MILIADDFESEIILLSEILIQLGFDDFLIANNGQEAIDLIQNNKIEFLITDYNMPYKNGGGVIKQALDSNVKSILLRSSHSVETLRAKMLSIGISNGYFVYQ
jgi:two-component system chemotaxis response regulator CheY